LLEQTAAKRKYPPCASTFTGMVVF
jgi:hypothetical protein